MCARYSSRCFPGSWLLILALHARASMWRSPTSWVTETTEVHCPTVLEAGRPRLGCQQGRCLLSVLKNLFRASPSFQWLAGHLWHSLACRSILLISAFIFTWCSLSVYLLPTSPFVTAPAALEQVRASELIAFAATRFPNKVRSEVLRVRPQHMNMDGDTVHSSSQPALQGRHYCSLQ